MSENTVRPSPPDDHEVDSDRTWWDLHERACREGAPTYVDPETGYRVFTRVGLERRERCCGCGCRHCPWGHAEVVERASHIKQPAFLHQRRARRTTPEARHALSWSGGKDSLLALRAWIRSQREQHAIDAILDALALITTFDATSRVVAHQDVPIVEIERQARALDLDFVAVPLHPGLPFVGQLEAGLDRVCLGNEAATGSRRGDGTPFLDALIFGDLHLEHVRDWRETELRGLARRLVYPLWHISVPELLDDLESSQVPCTVSACPGGAGTTGGRVEVGGIEIGSRFDRDLAELAAAAGWDPFGENGEFHTLARVWDARSTTVLGID